MAVHCGYGKATTQNVSIVLTIKKQIKIDPKNHLINTVDIGGAACAWHGRPESSTRPGHRFLNIIQLHSRKIYIYIYIGIGINIIHVSIGVVDVKCSVTSKMLEENFFFLSKSGRFNFVLLFLCLIANPVAI